MRFLPPRATFTAGEGEPVVLVHGFAGSSAWWSGTASALAERFRVVAPNLPGFGGAPPLPGPFSLDALAGALGALLEREGMSPAHVVGHSLGGSVALRLAAARPDAVRRLVLVASSGLPDRRPAAIQVLSAAAEGLRAPRERKPTLLGDVLRMSPYTFVAAARELAREDLSALLPHVAAPTLLLWGARDVLVPPLLARAFAAGLPDSRTVVLRRSSHVPMWDEPAAFTGAVGSFLAGEE